MFMVGQHESDKTTIRGRPMANRAKQKGTKFETDVVQCARAEGLPFASRLPLAGANDIGDIGGIPGVVLECKDHARLELSAWMDEAEREAATAGVDVFAVVHKRRRRPIREAYVTMPLHVFCAVIR